MRFLQKSIIRKTLLILAVYLAIFGLAFYFLESETISLRTFVGALAGGLVLMLFSFWLFLLRPLRVVLNEMRALIAGKPYKRIFTKKIDEVGVLAHFFNQVTKGLGEVSFSIKDRERILDELSVASQLQKDILPLESPDVPGLQIVAKNKPASELGGDCFNIFTAKDKTFMYIGDVTGHGAAAGLIMTMASSLISVFADLYDSPYEILVRVNKYIKKHVRKAMFMTLVMLVWDHKTQKMTYVGAGHEYILVYRHETGRCEKILSGGVALGMVPDNAHLIKEQEIALTPGDFIVLYTDGVTEARNKEGELYGLDRLKDGVIDYAAQYSAEGVNYHLARDLSTFMQGQKQLDDITLIVAKREDGLKSDEIKDKSTNWNV